MGYCATEKSITLGKLQKKILLMAWSFRGGGRAIKSGGGGRPGPLKKNIFFILLLFENKSYFTQDDISR